MGFHKILCPTDFSAGSDRALQVAIRLANDNGSELVLVHAWYIPPPSTSSDVGYPASVVEHFVEDAERLLDETVERAKHLGAKRVRGELVAGVPWIEITSLAERQGFDLCVIGTHGRTGLSRFLLGSVAEKVIRHAPCSVMAVHPEDTLKPFSHALVPFDFSPSSRLAVEVARRIVDTPGSITLLHVLELPARFSGEVPMAAFSERMNKRAAELLNREAETLARTSAHTIATRLRIGYPGQEILSVLAEDPRYDLIAMGSRGNTGLRRVVLGSVAEKTVRHAHCPVLVARLTPGETP